MKFSDPHRLLLSQSAAVQMFAAQQELAIARGTLGLLPLLPSMPVAGLAAVRGPVACSPAGSELQALGSRGSNAVIRSVTHSPQTVVFSEAEVSAKPIREPTAGSEQDRSSDDESQTSETTVSGVYYNNIEVSKSLHPLQQCGQGSSITTADVPKGRPLAGPPVLIKFGASEKGSFVKKAPAAIIKSRVYKARSTSAKRGLVKRQQPQLTADQKLFIEASAALFEAQSISMSGVHKAISNDSARMPAAPLLMLREHPTASIAMAG